MRFDCGRVSLDLVATRAGRAHVVEQLTAPDRLAAWIRGARLVPRDTPLAVDAGWLPRFTALREVVRRMVAAELAGRPPAEADVHALNAAARPAPPAPCALPDPDGALTAALASPPTCDQLLTLVARDALALLTDPLSRSRLRRCAGADCTRVYLDTSRGARRRWCSSETCGNRERVARHRRARPA